jgi:hypothetical protein
VADDSYAVNTVTKRTVKFIELPRRNRNNFILEIGKAGSYYTAKLDTNAGDLFTDEAKFETGEKKKRPDQRHVINVALRTSFTYKPAK